jgi:HD-GYP domain-containing protein (c-di-GMP phosphodiesterase class II)
MKVSNQDVVLSGGFGKSSNSARAGYLPICLERAPLDAFENIAVYLRSPDPKDKAAAGAATAVAETFRLYCSANIKFSIEHRERLRSNGTKFVYIAMADHARFREQTEASLMKTVNDPSLGVSIKSEIVYETSVELVNELLSEPDLGAKSKRLEQVSRAITTLVLNDPTAFSHLFAASHHDFYTATHMVNVATWMVPLAHAMGYHSTSDLNKICQAGLLHDVGKVHVSAEILNKKGKLSNEEWAMIKRHPDLGCEHLSKFEGIDPLVFAVTREHHERMDGSGYPRGIRGDQMHPVSRICAVVDSFDAMTAFRPFKERSMTVSQALSIIKSETPGKYDEMVVDTWLNLLQAAEREGVLSEPVKLEGDSQSRKFPRFPIHCPARLHLLETGPTPEELVEKPALQVIAHNISRGGAGFVSQQMVRPGERARLYLTGEGTLERNDDGLVVRCRAYKDGWYEVGMKFASLRDDLGGDEQKSVAA